MGEKDINFVHIMQVPFTGLGNFGGYRGDKWLINRIAIFKEFVLPSLIAQGSRDFYLWFQWRPAEKTNPIVKEFQEFIDGVRDVFAVHTFGGITFWDDKYSEQEASARLLKSLEISLLELKSYVGDLPYVLLTIQPSDDCYLSGATKILQAKFRELLEKEPDNVRRAVGWKEGYIMDYHTNEISEYAVKGWTTDETSTYHTDTILPFFTILFPNKTFLDPQEHYKHLGPYHSHEQIADYMDYTTIEGRGFIIGCHGENISTSYNDRYKGRILNKEEAEEIMIKSGLLLSKPIEFEPRRNILKRIYHTLPKKLQII